MAFRKFFETSNQRVLIIMRGVSGTGKSTRARQLAANGGEIFSTDDYFGQGQDYKDNFDQSLLPQAHQWNISRVEQAMKNGLSPIIVDNTNIMPYEAKPYVLLAKQHGYETKIEEPQSDHWRQIQDLHRQIQDLSGQLAGKNLHGAPPEVISQMISQYHPYGLEDAENSVAPWEK